MSLVTDYIISLGHLYGIVPMEKVVEIYNMQNNEPISMSDIDWVIENELDIVESHFVYEDGDFFTHETILEFDEFGYYMEQQTRKPYYIPPKKELLKYKDQFYFEKTKEYHKVESYLTKELTEGNKKKAQEISEEIALDCQMELSPSSILQDVSNYVEFKNEQQLGELMGLIVDLSNNSRIWSNNGHTPKEIFETYEKQHLDPLPQDNIVHISPRRKEKIGRNDSCPCGSGKKYKKCCL